VSNLLVAQVPTKLDTPAPFNARWPEFPEISQRDVTEPDAPSHLTLKVCVLGATLGALTAFLMSTAGPLFGTISLKHWAKSPTTATTHNMAALTSTICIGARVSIHKCGQSNITHWVVHLRWMFFDKLHNDDCHISASEPFRNTCGGWIVLFSSLIEEFPQIEGLGHSLQICYATHAVNHRDIAGFVFKHDLAKLEQVGTCL
jgi:hypothetical protein